MSNQETVLIEQLASLAHTQWSGWMRYLFKFGRELKDGTFVMDADKVQRWKRQMSTDYAQLPESERESDRVEARKVLAILDAGKWQEE